MELEHQLDANGQNALPVTRSEVAPAEVKLRNPRMRARFFNALGRNYGVIEPACREAGIPRHQVDYMRKVDPDFGAAIEECRASGADTAEREAYRRAVEGTTRPLVSAGKLVRDDDDKVIYLREYSDRLLELILKATKPLQYRDKVERDGIPASQVNVAIVLSSGDSGL